MANLRMILYANTMKRIHLLTVSTQKCAFVYATLKCKSKLLVYTKCVVSIACVGWKRFRDTTFHFILSFYPLCITFTYTGYLQGKYRNIVFLSLTYSFSTVFPPLENFLRENVKTYNIELLN